MCLTSNFNKRNHLPLFIHPFSALKGRWFHFKSLLVSSGVELLGRRFVIGCCGNFCVPQGITTFILLLHAVGKKDEEENCTEESDHSAGYHRWRGHKNISKCCIFWQWSTHSSNAWQYNDLSWMFNILANSFSNIIQSLRWNIFIDSNPHFLKGLSLPASTSVLSQMFSDATCSGESSSYSLLPRPSLARISFSSSLVKTSSPLSLGVVTSHLSRLLSSSESLVTLMSRLNSVPVVSL